MSRAFIGVAAFVALTAVSAEAGFQNNIEPGTLAGLRQPHAIGAKLRIEKVPLIDGKLETLDLERFDVYAPDAMIVAYGENGKVTRLPRPEVQFYRGAVAGEPESLTMIAVSAREGVHGFVTVGDRKFRMSSQRKRATRPAAPEFETTIDEVTVADEISSDENSRFYCDVEKSTYDFKQSLPLNVTSAGLQQQADAALATGSARWVLNIAVETDYELFQTIGGGNAANITTYIANLVAAVSTIYRRDLSTELRIAYQSVYSTPSDPFNVVPEVNDPATCGAACDGNPDTFDALVELQNLWRNVADPRSSVRRAAVMLVSGKRFPSPYQGSAAGVAYLNQLCSNNNGYGMFQRAGHDGGAANSNVPNPDLNAPTYQAVTSIYDNNYWSLLAFAHEFGHIVGANHTHCTALSAADQALYGRQFVDTCYSGESGCFNNGSVGAVDANVPVEKGTIMSYCHLSDQYGTGIRYLFGRTGEASNMMLTTMRARVSAATPAMSAITAPLNVTQSSSGNAASVTGAAGNTYAWTITNGTFTGGGTTATGGSVTFVAPANTNPITLSVTATNTSGCSGVTDSAQVLVGGVALAIPTGVAANALTGTSVSLAWNAVAGATGYEIDRRSPGVPFAQIGTSPTNAYVDNAAVPNTAYQYRVRATAGGSESADSAADFTTTFVFTDSTLTAGVTTCKSAHLTELRAAVDAVRALANIGGGTYSDVALSPSILIKAAHIAELRSALDAARASLAVAPMSYTDGSVTGGSTVVKLAHISDLRAGVR